MNPQILENAYQRVNFDREIVYKFFTIFSLFEYALKESEFKKVHPDGRIEPNWDCFARKIGNEFTERINRNIPELTTAVEYFEKFSPGKQVFQDNFIQFIQIAPNENRTVELSILIRRVRNNLFHGGKFIYDRYRDSLLIQFSIIILEEWASCHPDIRHILQDIQ